MKNWIITQDTLQRKGDNSIDKGGNFSLRKIGKAGLQEAWLLGGRLASDKLRHLRGFFKAKMEDSISMVLGPSKKLTLDGLHWVIEIQENGSERPLQGGLMSSKDRIFCTSLSSQPSLTLLYPPPYTHRFSLPLVEKTGILSAWRASTKSLSFCFLAGLL